MHNLSLSGICTLSTLPPGFHDRRRIASRQMRSVASQDLPSHETAHRITIRPMRDSDLSFVRRGLSETNWQDIPEDQKRFLNRAECDKRIFADFERYLNTERFKFGVFIAVPDDERPVGYVSVGELANPAVGLPLGSVLDFWVTREFRDRGIGTMLLDHALAHIHAQEYTHASILVSASNEKAIRMYEKRGFYRDRITMVKPLRPDYDL